MGGKLWALPITLIGLIYGIVNLIFRSTISFKYNAICFENCVFVSSHSAVTLGNCILCSTSLEDHLITYEGKQTDVPLGQHEIAHTFQYERLGLFFLIVWIVNGGPSKRNPLEIAADTYATSGEGWWPW